VLRLAAGLQHSLALMALEDAEEAGQMLFGWGSNEFSQLAGGDRTDEAGSDVAVPHQVLKSLGVAVAHLACHANYSALLSAEGEVRTPHQLFTWGRGDGGRLGYAPPLKIQAQPARVRLPVKVARVALGLFHALALSDSGQVFAWGSGASGQLGHDKLLTDVASAHQQEPKLVAAFADRLVSDVAAGAKHSLAVCSDGSAFAWGCNKKGQCGLGDCVGALKPKQVKHLEG